MTSVGKRSAVSHIIQTGGGLCYNWAYQVDPQVSTHAVSGSAVGESSGTRADPTMWGMSTPGDFTLTWGNNNPSLPRGNQDLLVDPQVAPDAAGAVFLETPLFRYDRISAPDILKSFFISADANLSGIDGDWDVVIVRYNASFVFQAKKAIAGGFLPFSAATPKSATFTVALSRFLGCFEGDSNGGDGGHLYAVRFRFLANSSNLLLSNLCVTDTPYQFSGMYIPTWSAGASVSLFQTPSIVQFSVNGDHVSLSGLEYLVMAGTSGTIVQSLPMTTKFPSDITSPDGGGNLYEYGGGSMSAPVNLAQGSSRCLINTGTVRWGMNATGATSNFFGYSFGYRLLNDGT